MALLFMDGFDVGDWALKWSSVTGTSTSSTTTRFSTGRSLALPTTGSVIKNFTAASSIFCGFAYYGPSLDNTTLFYLYGDSGATNHLILYRTAAGDLYLKRGTTVLASAVGIFTAMVWSYIEVWATVADSGGRCVVKANGATVIDFTGDTKNAGTATTIDRIMIGATGAAGTFIDDVYICDGTGSAPNNTFLGDVRVHTLLPNAIGTSSQWTPQAGDNYDNVNDVPYVPTTYNSADVSGYRDTYGLPDLSGTGTIFGIQDNTLAYKTDAGAANIKPALKSGATVYYDADLALGASLLHYSAVRVVDPATSAVWDETGINALEYGAEVI